MLTLTTKMSQLDIFHVQLQDSDLEVEGQHFSPKVSTIKLVWLKMHIVWVEHDIKKTGFGRNQFIFSNGGAIYHRGG